MSNSQLEYALQDAFNRFQQSTQPGLWPHIRKDDLLRDIEKRLANPYRVRQRRTPLCGPAAIVFELVRRMPERYVALCQSLYETGAFWGAASMVEPSQKLLYSHIPYGMSPADWMLLATMRDVENALFSVDSQSNELALGISTPWEMNGWVKELLNFDNAHFDSTLIYGEFDAMEHAEQVHKQDGVSFLLVNGNLLQGQELSFWYPDHWVSFLGNLQLRRGHWYQGDGGSIDFDCYSWGQRKQIAVNESRFEDAFWGLVWAA